MLKFVEDENGHIVGVVQVIDDEDGVVDNGMTIDKAITWLNTDYYESKGFADATSVAIDTMRKYQQLQADYETRLKADMVAMLTEIQLEFEEHEESIIGHYGKETKERDFPSHKIERNTGRKECIDLIQEKINELKAESEPQESEET